MGSSSVAAQRIANAANVEMANATNYTQQQIAEHANQWNWSNMQAQNEWNIQQWDRENAYNSPKEQVKRYMEAGINPLWAIGNGNPGNAQQLTSADVPSAEVADLTAPQVIPEYDPYKAQHIGNIIAAVRDVNNSLQGWERLGLEERQLDIAERTSQFKPLLDLASAAEKRATTEGQNLTNEWSFATLPTRISQASSQLRLTNEQIETEDKTQAEKDASIANLLETKKLISSQIYQTLIGIKQRFIELGLMSRQTSVAEQNAQSNRLNADVNQQNAYISEARFGLDVERYNTDLQQQNNENLLNFMKSFAGVSQRSTEGKINVLGQSLNMTENTTSFDIPSAEKAVNAGLIILQRAADDPSSSNLNDAHSAAIFLQQSYVRLIQSLKSSQTSTNTSVLNP